MSERAVPFDVPGLKWDGGAPSPVLMKSDRDAFIAFYGPGLSRVVRTAEFVGCTAVSFGFPDDEAVMGHRLAERGLRSWAGNEVLDSTWLRDLRAVEAVHPNAPDLPFPDARHFILQFKEQTLEVIADEVRVLGIHDTMARALEDLSRRVLSAR